MSALKKSHPRLLNLPLSPKHSALLFGPRGTGKTFWITQNLQDTVVFNLQNGETFTTLAADPSRLNQRIPDGFKGWVVIDEVQKIPALLDEAHYLIEKKGYKFLLTSSNIHPLKKQGANLLAGRARKHTMHPFTCIELGDDFSLPKALQFGMLPEVYIENDPQSYLNTYIHTYLQEEVLQEGLTRNIGVFTRFLEVASFAQGEILNVSEIAREVGISRKIVAEYFDITIDLLLGIKLPVFTKRAQRQLVAHPKFYFFDVGVYRAIRPMGPLDIPEKVEGHALETLVLQHLRAFNDYHQLGYKFYYWRTKNGLEVDFIAYGEKGLIAFEIKRKRNLNGKDLRALKAFQKDYPMAKLYCFYGGNMAEHHGAITALPIEEGLRKLPEILS